MAVLAQTEQLLPVVLVVQIQEAVLRAVAVVVI
jgi:hypothetical protein